MIRVARAWWWIVVVASGGGCVVEYDVVEEGTTTAASTGQGDTSPADDCPGTWIRCGDACVDPLADPDHCGGCGDACAAGSVCDLGDCAASCGAGRTACARACVDLTSDPLHCGRCDETCDIDGACVAGDCKDGCNDQCELEDGEVCVGDECECMAGLEQCNGDCVDLQTDHDHCGECGNECEDLPCVGGECQPPG